MKKTVFTSVLKYCLNITIGILILGFLFTRVPVKDVAQVISRSKPQLFLLSLLIGVVSIAFTTLRWQVLLRYVGYRYNFMFLLKLGFISLFFNIYVPSGLAGDFARVMMLLKGKKFEDRKLAISNITASVITDRVSGMVGLLFLATMSLFFYYRILADSRIIFIFLLAGIIIILIFLVLFSRRVQRFFKNMLKFNSKFLDFIKNTFKDLIDALHIYRKNYSVFIKVIPISILSHLCVILYFYTLSRSVEVDISFLKFVVFVPIIEIVASIPLSFGGVGIREAATILLFGLQGVPASVAMSISLLSFALILILGLFGGITFLADFMVNKKPLYEQHG